MLNSIQGLQQRLGGFPIEVVAAAEANANTLIHRLALLQNKLDQLARLKRSLTDAEAMIQQIPETDFNLIGPASLEKHPQLHAIVNATKIIRLHKLLKVARASAESVSFDPNVGRLDIATPLAPAIAPTREQKYPGPLAQPQSETKSEIPSKTRNTAKESSALVIELPPPPSLNESDPQVLVKNVLTKLPGVEIEKKSESIDSSVPSTLNSTAYVAEEGTADIFLPETTTVDEEPKAEKSIAGHEDRVEVTPTIPIQVFGQKSNAAISPEVPPTGQAIQGRKAVPEFDDERAWAAMDSDFDQRLLDELIQIYGEFVPSNKTAVRPAQSSASPNPTPATAAPIEAARESHEAFESHAKPPAARPEPSLPPEPKFVSPESATVVAAAAVEAIEVNVPSVRARDDLDRQLKKIIKDYGEYDIYSQQSSPTLRRSGIAAFIVLGLVLCAVYFLRSPTQTEPPEINSVLQSERDSKSAAPQATNDAGRASNVDKNAPGELKRKSDGDNSSNEAKTKPPQNP